VELWKLSGRSVLCKRNRRRRRAHDFESRVYLSQYVDGGGESKKFNMEGIACN